MKSSGAGQTLRRALALDLGGILVRLGVVDQFWSTECAAAAGTGEAPTYQQRWNASRAVVDFETGVIRDYETFIRRARQEMAVQVDDAGFDRIYRGVIQEPFAGTRALLEVLSARRPVYLFSNTSPVHWAMCRDDHDLGRFFAKAIVSCEIGYMKPDPRFFAEAVRQVGLPPEQIWFYDDRAENVAGAAAAGIQARESRGGPRLFADLVREGFLTVTQERQVLAAAAREEQEEANAQGRRMPDGAKKGAVSYG